MQMTLFDQPAPTRQTSLEALGSVQHMATHVRDVILACIRARGADGMTDQEVQQALGLPGDTQRPRRRELVAAGQVRDSGRRRSTPTGRAAIIWIAVD